jgi:hypothetical protein
LIYWKNATVFGGRIIISESIPMRERERALSKNNPDMFEIRHAIHLAITLGQDEAEGTNSISTTSV